MWGGNVAANASGLLYVVATPIGNLADISQRALQVLREVAVIAAEVTRHTRRLLTHYGIAGKLSSLHEHNEADAMPRLLARLGRGEDVALVSDAGTPLISDPGFLLVQEARKRGYPVVPVPGPSAAVCALSAGGLPCDRFLFVGFPPRTTGKRLAWFDELRHERATLVLYETANRVSGTLRDLGLALGGGRRAVVARELTKRFETFLCGALDEVRQRLDADPEQRQGEIVILVEGQRTPDGSTAQAEEERVLGILAAELPLKQAAALAARITGGKKNRLYQLALRPHAERDLGAGADLV
jgi:16S rRNA (cytidine1402-2'-O)-methyltransferase